MRSRWALLFVVMHIAGFSDAATAQTLDQQRCLAPDPDLSISRCTAMIQSGHETQQNLAFAFRSRGIAYARKGQYDRAIEDLDQAIRLDPNDAVAFSNRGGAYNGKGQYDRAIEDRSASRRPCHGDMTADAIGSAAQRERPLRVRLSPHCRTEAAQRLAPGRAQSELPARRTLLLGMVAVAIIDAADACNDVLHSCGRESTACAPLYGGQTALSSIACPIDRSLLEKEVAPDRRADGLPTAQTLRAEGAEAGPTSRSPERLYQIDHCRHILERLGIQVGRDDLRGPVRRRTGIGGHRLRLLHVQVHPRAARTRATRCADRGRW
jgi:TPR repeat